VKCTSLHNLTEMGILAFWELAQGAALRDQGPPRPL